MLWLQMEASDFLSLFDKMLPLEFQNCRKVHDGGQVLSQTKTCGEKPKLKKWASS
jgi:hypothetical protein